jgi:hypothetical protein
MCAARSPPWPARRMRIPRIAQFFIVLDDARFSSTSSTPSGASVRGRHAQCRRHQARRAAVQNPARDRPSPRSPRTMRRPYGEHRRQALIACDTGARRPAQRVTGAVPPLHRRFRPELPECASTCSISTCRPSGSRFARRSPRDCGAAAGARRPARTPTTAASRDLPDLLKRRRHALVFNDTRVIPAQLEGIRERDGSVATIAATLHRRLTPESLAGLRPQGREAAARSATLVRLRRDAGGVPACGAPRDRPLQGR